MMFVMGLMVGAFVMMCLGAVSMGIMARGVHKEREKDGDRYKVEASKLMDYWDESNKARLQQNAILSDILSVIDK